MKIYPQFHLGIGLNITLEKSQWSDKYDQIILVIPFVIFIFDFNNKPLKDRK